MSKIYGWYDSEHQANDKPTYNPPLDSPCPYCHKPLAKDDMRTHSIMIQSAPQCFFYRTHRTCDESASDEQRQIVEGKIWDMISDDKVLAGPINKSSK